MREWNESLSYCSKTTGCEVIASNRNLDCLHIFNECQLLDVLKTRSFGPIPTINSDDSRSNDVLLDDLVHLRLGICRGGYNENLCGLEDLKLVEGPNIELIVTYLAEDCLTSRDVDKAQTDGGRDASTLTDSTYYFLAFTATNGGSCSRSTASGSTGTGVLSSARSSRLGNRGSVFIVV